MAGSRARLGRDASCEVRLPDLGVAPVEAEVAVGRDGRWQVEQVAARPGTTRNDRRLRPGRPEPLADGDELRVGPFSLTARLLDERTLSGSSPGDGDEARSARLAAELVVGPGGAGDPGRLVVVAGPEEGVAGPLPRDGGSLTLGRSRACGWRLADRRLSRVHGRLGRDGGALWLEDLGSRNGVVVGGRRIRGRCRLAHGDRVEVGSHLLEVRPAAEVRLRETAGGEPAGVPRGDLPDVVVGLVGATLALTLFGWLLLG